MDFLRLPASVLDDEYEKLSGGEKQRIAILIALLLKRNIFLLDEVTSFLDAELKKKIITFFTQNREWTVLAISHDPDWLDADNIKVIRLGE